MPLAKYVLSYTKEMTHTSSFGLEKARDFYDEIVFPQYQDFLQKNSSKRHALLTIISAYHLYEWVHRTKFTRTDFKNRYPNESEVEELFETARHLTNGTKHYKNKAVKTRAQGGFSSAFSNAFARPLIIIKPDSSEVSADEFCEALIGFWQRQVKSGSF